VERTIQYIKDRTESFDDYFPSIRKKKNCKLKHVRNWLKLFKDIHNNDLKLLKRTELFNDKGHLNIIKKYIN
jgi:putative transposase